jgi:hypothetical protein
VAQNREIFCLFAIFHDYIDKRVKTIEAFLEKGVWKIGVGQIYGREDKLDIKTRESSF